MSSYPSPPASPFTKDDRDRAVKGIEKMFVISLLQKKKLKNVVQNILVFFFPYFYHVCVSTNVSNESKTNFPFKKHILQKIS